LFLIPIKAGEFKHITEIEFEKMKTSFFANGIYKAVITYPDEDEEKWKKVFRLNCKNKYTHIDMNWARKIGMNMKYVDEKINFLYYSRDKCLRGNECFKEYTDILYKLKKDPETSSRAKQLLTALWGALSQSNIFEKTVTMDEEFEPFDDREIVSVEPCNELLKIKLVKKTGPFKTNWARIKPFIMAKARMNIAEYILPVHQHIHRSHTDSMLSDIPLNIKLSKDIGKMKIEKNGVHCVIKNSMKVVFEDD
jgi:hypothetical protein